jgi:hypothetical protein
LAKWKGQPEIEGMASAREPVDPEFPTPSKESPSPKREFQADNGIQLVLSERVINAGLQEKHFDASKGPQPRIRSAVHCAQISFASQADAKVWIHQIAP